MTPSPPAATPRIAPGTWRDVGLVNYAICRAAGRVTRTNPPHLFLTLARSHGLFRGWLWYSSKLMPFGRLSRRETELVILRIADLRACEYEFAHHVRIGRRAGVTATDVERLRQGLQEPGWSERERMMLAAVTELIRTQDIEDATWQALRDVLDERECVELVMLGGQYDSLATAILTLRIEPDR